jgi:hypothetical protein
MILLIDYHTGTPADAIAPADNLALISISQIDETTRLPKGWKYSLELALADESRVGYNDEGFTAKQADRVFDFCWRLGRLQDSIALIIRCSHSRRGSAAIAKALGEWTGVWVKDPGLLYSRRVYELMRARIGTLESPDVVRLMDLATKYGADHTRQSTKAQGFAE